MSAGQLCDRLAIQQIASVQAALRFGSPFHLLANRNRTSNHVVPARPGDNLKPRAGDLLAEARMRSSPGQAFVLGLCRSRLPGQWDERGQRG